MIFLGLRRVIYHYLTTKAAADHKTSAGIIGELVQEKIAAAL